MPPVDISQKPNEGPPEMDGDDWVPVGHFDSLHEANEHGLVILAMGEACRVEPAPAAGQFDLQAERGPAVNIAGELDEYAKEQAEEKARPPARHFPTRPAGAWLCCLWALILTAVFVRQAADDTLVERGASSSIGLFARGEWWRPFTALFLHADIPHLVGNLLAGCLFATFVARSAGAVRGWLLIFASGIAGNVLTAWVMYPQPFISLGASTAVFGALGILSGMGLIEMLHERTRRQVARITAPLLAGLVLLSWLGSGTQGQTDVLAHVFGFGSGLAAGAASGAFDARSSIRT